MVHALHLPFVEPVQLLSHFVWAGQVHWRRGRRFLNSDQVESQQEQHGVGTAGFSLVAGEADCWPSDPKKRAGPSARSCLTHRRHHSLQIKIGSAEVRSRCNRSVSQGILRRRNRHYCSMRIFPAWPMVMPARAPLQTLLEGIRIRFPRLVVSSLLLARSNR